MNAIGNLLSEILTDANNTVLFYRGKSYLLSDDDCPVKAAATYIKSRLKKLEEGEG
jgi:hypothetical protein